MEHLVGVTINTGYDSEHQGGHYNFWVLFYTTIKSFNSDRENLSHCPKSYFDAIANYYEVAQMLLKHFDGSFFAFKRKA